jgi:hypothetical protein
MANLLLSSRIPRPVNYFGRDRARSAVMAVMRPEPFCLSDSGDSERSPRFRRSVPQVLPSDSGDHGDLVPPAPWPSSQFVPTSSQSVPTSSQSGRPNRSQARPNRPKAYSVFKQRGRFRGNSPEEISLTYNGFMARINSEIGQCGSSSENPEVITPSGSVPPVMLESRCPKCPEIPSLDLALFAPCSKAASVALSGHLLQSPL